MASPSYTDAEIYVDADPALHTHIRRILADRGGGESDYFDVHVGKHKAYTPGTDPDHFLGWRTLIDVTATDRVSDQAMVTFVGEILSALASAGYRSTAVCPFSDEIRRP